jgi:hypothetical protein
VFTITTDNATVNEVAIDYMRREVEGREILFWKVNSFTCGVPLIY